MKLKYNSVEIYAIFYPVCNVPTTHVVVFHFDYVHLSVCLYVCLLSVAVTSVSCAGISRSVQVTISGDSHSLLVTKLVENVKYVFSVRARTKIDWGDAVNGSTTTGPQKGLYHRAPTRVVTERHTNVYTLNILFIWTQQRNVHHNVMTSGRFLPQSYR